MRSFSQLRRELSKNDLFYLDTGGKGSTERSLAVIDQSGPPVLQANDLEGVTESDKNDLHSELKRVDSAPQDADNDAFYPFGNCSDHIYVAIVSTCQFTFADTDQMAMTEYSPSRSGSTEGDRITILSKSETPTPPLIDKSDTGTENIDENRGTGNGSRKSILNSWNEGISLEGANDPNDRLQVAFEGKNCSLPVILSSSTKTPTILAERLKSEIKRAYDVLNNDIREKKGKEEDMWNQGWDSGAEEQSSHASKEESADHANYSSSTKQDVSPSSRVADASAQPDPRATSPAEDNFHVVEGTDMPTKDFFLLKV